MSKTARQVIHESLCIITIARTNKPGRYRLHVSERLLDQHDGSMLEALKKLNGGTLNLPARAKDYPDRDRLALRFERFKAAA